MLAGSCRMQQLVHLRGSAFVVLLLFIRVDGKTLPVPYSTQGGLSPQSITTIPRVTSFEGVAEPTASPAQTFVLLYGEQHAGSALLGAGSTIEAAGGTVIAHHPAIGVSFATSTVSSFAADMRAADSRLTHVTTTGGVGRQRRLKATANFTARSSIGGLSSGGGGGSNSNDNSHSSTSELRDDEPLRLGRKESAAGVSSAKQRGSTSQRRLLDLIPVQAPSLEMLSNSVPTSSPGASAGGMGRDPAAEQPPAASPPAGAAKPPERVVTIWGDPLSEKQWGMRAIKVPQASAITSGSRNVTVAIIDSGVDASHVDLASQVDATRSVSCMGGALNHDPASWMDHDGHGTACAGIVGAAKNGIGVVGVAPGVTLVAIRASDPKGLFLVEAVVCAFMYAGDIGADVTSNSYYSDPWLYNCKDSPDQYAIWAAETRAMAYAMGKGVTVVVGAGNGNVDLDHPTTDDSSPNNGVPIQRNVTLDCPQLPSQVAGVLDVSATGPNGLKAPYSNHGQLFIGVAAPGGDTLFQSTAQQNGGILTTYPSGSDFLANNGFPVTMNVNLTGGATATYAYLQGTSMSAPHVAGVAALAISAAGRRLPPAQVLTILQSSAQPIACPSSNPYMPGGPPKTTGPDAGISTGYEANCTGPPGHTSFYGYGLMDAHKAVLMAQALA